MVLGITGGIASGKSTLAAMLMELGGPHGVILVSADAIARELLAPGTDTTNQVLEHFGDSVQLPSQEDAIDRSKLAARIFGDAEDRKWLERLMHPIIDVRIRNTTQPYLGKPVSIAGEPHYNLALAEIPLLYEVNIDGMVDAVVVAWCTEQTQLSRLRQRHPALTEAQALQQIRTTQIPIAKKVELATNYVIDTEPEH